MCTFGTKFPNIDNWNYISKFRIWYLEMDVHFQKSIFGILVPNGPYKKVLPKKFGHKFSGQAGQILMSIPKKVCKV